MNLREWFDDDRKLGIAVSGAASIYVAFETVRTGQYLDDGWPHPFLISGLLSGVFCAGLVFRQAWSRWVGFVLLAGLLVLALWHVYLHGMTRARFVAIAAFPFLALYLWRMPITKVQALLSDPDYLTQVRQRAAERSRKRGPKKQWKIAVLYRDEIELDAERLAGVAERAFGESFGVIDRDIDPVDAVFLPSEHSGPVVGGIAPTLLCYHPPHLLGVYVVCARHPGLTGRGAHHSDSHHAFGEHRAFVEVLILPHLDSTEPVTHGYSWSGKLAAELINEKCVGVYLPDRNRVIPVSSILPEALRSSDPEAALDL